MEFDCLMLCGHSLITVRKNECRYVVVWQKGILKLWAE